MIRIVAQREIRLSGENTEVLKTGEVIKVSRAGDDIRIGVGSSPLLEVGTKTHGARISPVVSFARRKESVSNPRGQSQSTGNDDGGERHQSLLVFVPDFSHSLTPLIGLVDERIVHVERKILADRARLKERQRKDGIIIDIEIESDSLRGLLSGSLGDGRTEKRQGCSRAEIRGCRLKRIGFHLIENNLVFFCFVGAQGIKNIAGQANVIEIIRNAIMLDAIAINIGSVRSILNKGQIPIHRSAVG
jgi:hypothetical protein